MAPEKAVDHRQGATSKGKIHCHHWGIIPLSSLSPVIEEPASVSSQEEAGDAHPPSPYEGQLLQMIAGMKEAIAKQQDLFDHKLELNRENSAREREELKHLNDQLLASKIPMGRFH